MFCSPRAKPVRVSPFFVFKSWSNCFSWVPVSTLVLLQHPEWLAFFWKDMQTQLPNTVHRFDRLWSHTHLLKHLKFYMDQSLNEIGLSLTDCNSAHSSKLSQFLKLFCILVTSWCHFSNLLFCCFSHHSCLTPDLCWLSFLLLLHVMSYLGIYSARVALHLIIWCPLSFFCPTLTHFSWIFIIRSCSS